MNSKKSVSLRIELNVKQLHEIFDANQGTINGIRNLSEKIESIWDIVSLINNVADQAKIIAFNAELEASSAGEAGKSFRIVASEQILLAIKEIASGVENFTVATDNISGAAENVRKISEDLNNVSQA